MRLYKKWKDLKDCAEGLARDAPGDNIVAAVTFLLR